MQKAELILTKLYQKSRKEPTFKFQRLYRNLYNIDLYLQAYAKIQSKEGNMTKGTDRRTIDGFNLKKVEKMIIKLKSERYKPRPVRRTYIPKKNKKKKRPLGIPSFEDKLLQEALRQILQAIYEPIFSNKSHGFRPERSCHTALHAIKTIGTGATWAIEGDISSFFDTIDHEILLNILKRKIKDGRVIELIKRFLKAGFMEHNIIRNTITGTPQGGLISPLLANIYLNELDEYIEAMAAEYNTGKYRKRNKTYLRLQKKIRTLGKMGKPKEAHFLKKQLIKIPHSDYLDPDYRRIQYIRYADDFIVLIIGSKNMAKEIKNKINNFLNIKLNIKLNQEKTVITNLLTKKARFLGYQICKAKDDTHIITNSLGHKTRSINGTIQLYMPYDVMQTKIKPFRKKNKPWHLPERANSTILEIISHYNAEIRGLYEYYSMANNVAERMQTFKYYHYFSMVKTIANKEKSSVSKVIKKYGIPVKRRDKQGTRNIIAIEYTLKNGGKNTLTYYNERLIKRKEYHKCIKPISDKFLQSRKCGLLDRISKNKCELCKENKKDIEVHHIRKLKDIKKKWKKNKQQAPEHIQLMIKMNRKTLVVCKNCHDKIHS